MPKYIDQNCPLCDRPAKYCSADHDNIKYFVCKYCIDYYITINGENRLTSRPKEWKHEVSEAARNIGQKQIVIIQTPEIANLKSGEPQLPVWAPCNRSTAPPIHLIIKI